MYLSQSLIEFEVSLEQNDERHLKQALTNRTNQLINNEVRL